MGNEPERNSPCWMEALGLHPGGQGGPSKGGQESMSSNSPPELHQDFDGGDGGCSPGRLCGESSRAGPASLLAARHQTAARGQPYGGPQATTSAAATTCPTPQAGPAWADA